MPEIMLTSIGDSYTDRSNPSTNYGSAYILGIDYTLSSPFRYCQPFLHFSVASIPPNKIIDSAFFHIYVIDNAGISANNRIYTLKTNWTEMALTWNNKPFPKTYITGSLFFNKIGWINVGVTELIQLWYAEAENNYGITIEPEYKTWPYGRAYFYSREVTPFAPYIVVNYSNITTRPLWTNVNNNLSVI